MEQASAALRDAGLDLAPGDLTVEMRGDRNLVRLPDERLAWFPITDRARVPPDQPSCGHTLAEDLEWVRAALAQL